MTTTDTTETTTEAPRSRPRRRAILAGLAAVAALSGILAAGLTLASGPGTITARGAVEVTASGGESTQSAYPDVTSGGQVTVVSSSGDVIGTGTLSFDAKDTTTANAGQAGLGVFADAVTVYRFTVTVPAGLPRYGVEIGNHRGTVYFSAAQMRRGPALSLGS